MRSTPPEKYGNLAALTRKCVGSNPTSSNNEDCLYMILAVKRHKTLTLTFNLPTVNNVLGLFQQITSKKKNQTNKKNIVV